MMRKMAILILIFHFNTCAFGQLTLKDSLDAELEKYSRYDFLKHNYKYLDSNYRIVISDELFKQFVNDYRFIPERLNSYKDSVAVVIMGEFNSWTATRIATLKLTMSWLRVGYYLWMTAEEAEKLGERYAFKMPYTCYDYIYSRSDLWDDFMIATIDNLRKKVYAETKDEAVLTMDTAKLLNYALVANPVRKKDFERISRHRH